MTMKASVYRQYGAPDVLHLEEVEKPAPQANELLIQVYATSVNRTDCAQLRAKPFFMRFMTGLITPTRTILGTTFAGKIVAIGGEVDAFQMGDDVFGFDDNGLSSHTQYLIQSADKGLAKMPHSISYEQAAASIEGEHYAVNFINKVDLKRGDSVLVNGASGAIGSATVQLLKHYGANVTAVCSGESIAMIESLGVDRIIDYSDENFTKMDLEVDYVFDSVGKSTFGKCKSILKTGGVYISSELGPMAQNLFLSIFTPLFGGKKVKFPLPVDIKGSVLLMKKLLEDGDYKPVIDRTYPLERIADAFRYVETGQKLGNVVIHIGHEPQTKEDLKVTKIR